MSGQQQPVVSYTGRAEKEDHSFLTSLMHMYVVAEVRDNRVLKLNFCNFYLISTVVISDM